MGIGQKSSAAKANGAGPSKLKGKGTGTPDKAVTFAADAVQKTSDAVMRVPPPGGESFVPLRWRLSLTRFALGLSPAEREEWANFKSSGGIESRRTSHKAAEQKRRDSLKFCFDELRGMLPGITLDDDAPGGSYLGPDGALEDIDVEQFDPAELCDAETSRLANRAISKVALLRHSNEYLVRITTRLARRDAALADARNEIVQLRAALGLPPPANMHLMGPQPVGYMAGMQQFILELQEQQKIAASSGVPYHPHLLDDSQMDLSH
jgi:hypothetical protein